MSAKQETIVPGVNNVGNRRPRVKGGKTKEVRAYVPVKQPVVETTDSYGTKTTVGIMSDISTIETDLSTLKNKQVSLRDLCVEDKKRVANLIKELAKVGEEKENAEQNLVSERNHYQDQILKLVEQQEMVLKEREEVQKKLLEYQNLIVKLQQDQQLHYLRQQREKHQKLQHGIQVHPEKEKETVSLKVAKGEKNVKSKRSVISPKDILPRKEDVTVTISKPQPHFHVDAVESSCLSEEDKGHSSPVELPSQNFYMNELAESDVDEFSTQALPGLSPPHSKGQSGSRLYRPFTAMIDQELALQQAALSAVGYVSQGQSNEPREETAEVGNINSKHFNDESSHLPKVNSVFNQVKDHNVEEIKAHHIQEQEEPQHNNQGRTNINENCLLPSRSLVSPEKAEIFNRFMHSHHQDQNIVKTIEGQRESVDSVKADGKKSSKDNGRAGRQKKKKRPPATLGLFHPPVMSSTQKSSEIGDYADSTINSEKKIPEMKESQPQRVDNGIDRESDEDKETDDERGLMNKQRYEKVGADADDDIIYIEKSHKHDNRKGKRDKKKEKSRVEFSDQPKSSENAKPAMLGETKQLDVDPDYLLYYKNLSASERKKELLKQRSMLLEEQNKLKKVLVEQESKLMVKQAEAMAKREDKDYEREEDKVVMKKMHDSLEEMEQRLAQKEAELRKERELLMLKRTKQKNHTFGLALTGSEYEQTQNNHMQLDRNDLETKGDATTDNMSRSKPILESGDMIRNHLPSLNENKTFSQTEKDIVSNLQPFHQLNDVGSGGFDMKPESGDKEENSKMVQKTSQKADSKDLESKTTSSAFRAKELPEEDTVVRRLDYSFHSDAEPDFDTAQEEGNISKLKDKDVEGSNPSTREQRHQTTPRVPTMVDAGTSISFANFARTESDSPVGSKVLAGEVKDSAKKPTRKKHLSESPGEKTLAVVEIINSLDDLSGSGKRFMDTDAKGIKQINRRKFAQRKNCDMMKTLSSPLKSSPLHYRTQQSPFRPELYTKSKISSSVLQSKAFESHRSTLSDHAELELFHLPQFKEDRLDGYRRLINRDTDESDDMFYEYDENDDSNIDDIVNALSDSLNKGLEDEEGGQQDSENESIWNSVVKDLNNFSSLKLPDDVEDDNSFLADEMYEGLNMSSDKLKQEYVDDNDILEEIFFVKP